MNSPGDREKPPGNAGDVTETHEGDHGVVEQVVIQVYQQPVPRTPSPEAVKTIDWQNSHVRLGYELLEAIIREQQMDLLRAITSNVRRHGWRDRLPDLAAGGTAASTGFMYGHPLIGFGIGLALAIGRSVKDTIRIRRNKDGRDSKAAIEVRTFLLRIAAQLSMNASGVRIDQVPAVAEFQILWVRHAWRLVHYLKGYNTRLEAVKASLQALDRTQEEEGAAWEILMLLTGIQPQLVRAQQALDDLYFAELEKTGGRMHVLHCLDDRVQAVDPFQDSNRDLPGLEWLPLKSDKLTRAELPKLAEQDRLAFDSSKEIHTQQIDLELAALEAKYGFEVDQLILERARRREEEQRAREEASGEGGKPETVSDE